MYARSTPLVSIIVRSMDRPTLSDALDSIAQQTYPNIEVVVVNAKGTEHHGIAERLGKFTLRLIRKQEPLKRSRAANLGLEAAKGEYIGFLDDDDWLAPDHISHLVDTLQENPEKIAAYSAIIGTDENKQPSDKVFGRPFDRILLLAGNYIPIHAVLFHRRVADAGCRVEEHLDLYEDWDFWLQATQLGDFVYTGHTSGYYRIGGAFGQGVSPDPVVMENTKGQILEKWKSAWRHEDLLEIMARVAQHDARLIELTGKNYTLAEENCKLLEENHKLFSTNNRLQIESEELEKETTVINQRLVSLYQDIRNLQIAIDGYRRSTSWRITEPVRVIGHWIRRSKQLLNALASHRARHPGFTGYRRIAHKLYTAWRSGGLRGLTNLYAIYRNAEHTNLKQPSPAPIECIEEHLHKPGSLPVDQRIAVHLHAFYTELLPEICGYLANISFPFTLLVTTDSEEKAARINEVLQPLAVGTSLIIKLVENRGRDIAPLIVGLGEQLQSYDLVLHIHTKQSPHNPDLRGWRTYLMQALLGSREGVAAIIDRFQQDQTLGILYPAPYYPVLPFMRLGGNAKHIFSLLRKSHRSFSDMSDIDECHFPAGAMFWFRGKAIGPLVKLSLSNDDFEPEAGQDDATLAHAIERMVPYFASLAGLSTISYLPASMHCPSAPGALPLRTETIKQLFSGGRVATVFFDHNIGGGTNTYSNELSALIVEEGRIAIRVYYARPEQTWIVQIIDRKDGMIHAAPTVNELFDALANANCDTIIINSLVGFDDVDILIGDILQLSTKLGAQINYKLHDYYAVCPSQHLMNDQNRYCGVPLDKNICDACFRSNPHVGIDRNRFSSISAWRGSFAKLFDAAKEIDIFDDSSIAILGRAFDSPINKLTTRPHNNHASITYDHLGVPESLHIGILGTLTLAKGADVVNALAEYLAKENPTVSITLVGRSLVHMHPGVRILGAYDVRMLGDIVAKNKISVFFMASIIPETFSYTISEAIAMGLPIVAFDVGAQASRINAYAEGQVIPLNSSPDVIFNTLHETWSHARNN